MCLCINWFLTLDSLFLERCEGRWDLGEGFVLVSVGKLMGWAVRGPLVDEYGR